jgi:CRISPR/Cas system-associated exonuclease Cas4 (RecB family)
MDIHGLLKTALVTNDKARERSMQKEIGASSVFGCSRQAWNIIHMKPKTNLETESLGAIIGTAVHEVLAKAMAEADMFGDDFLIEQEFKTPDLKGHVDLYVKSSQTVIDWKTTTKKNMPKFPSPQQRMQVQLYGYLLEENGYPVTTVALCAIPRDGWMKDVKVHSEPYDREIALQGIEWVHQLQTQISPPAPERPRNFCKDFCEYFDATGVKGCQGK